jgi:hypothetical protein
MAGASLRSGGNTTNKEKTKAFIAKARAIHGRKYDYSRVRFRNMVTRVEIVCRKHGSFYSFPNNLIRGHGCAVCARAVQASTRLKNAAKTFVNRAKMVHGARYLYSHANYRGAYLPVKIYCKAHKSFFRVAANNHLQGRGCQKCGRDNQLAAARRKKQTASDAFVVRAQKMHGQKYCYSRVSYVDSRTPVEIICLSGKHGSFRQTPNNHLFGKGCPQCGSAVLAQRTLEKRRKLFIKLARKTHGRKYDYSQVAFKNTNEKVLVICRKHGGFNVRPTHHTTAPYSGCPVCIESLGERAIRQWLKGSQIPFVAEKRFADCRDKRPLVFDFWLPTLKAVIEYDGEQHYDAQHYLSTLSDFSSARRRDRIKTAYARKKKIRLIRVKYSVRDVEAFLVKKLGLKAD